MNKVAWSIEDRKEGKILIRDDYDENNPTMSITNGVEEVLDRLNQNGWLDENPQLFYRDTEGQIDKINYAFGMSRDKIKFLGFDFGGWE